MFLDTIIFLGCCIGIAACIAAIIGLFWLVITITMEQSRLDTAYDKWVHRKMLLHWRDPNVDLSWNRFLTERRAGVSDVD